jgi:hypothetical protein
LAPHHDHTTYHPYITSYTNSIPSNTHKKLAKLNKPIEPDKVTAALKKTKPLSSPGPDLLPYKVYNLPHSTKVVHPHQPLQ